MSIIVNSQSEGVLNVLVKHLMLLLIFSCNHKDSSNDHSNYKILKFNQHVQINISGNIYDSLEIPLNKVFNKDFQLIPLLPDASNRGLVRNIQRIERINNKWIIFDASPSNTDLLVFNSNGEFQYVIGEKGKGPGEFSIISAYNINRSKSRIEIFDNMLGKILFYNFKGKFLKEIKLNVYFSDYTFDSNLNQYLLFTLDCNNTLFKRNFPLSSNYVITLANSSLLPLKGLGKAKVAKDGTPFFIGKRFNSDCDNTVYINQAYNNKFYLFDKTPVLKFQINIPQIAFKDEYDLLEPVSDRFTSYTNEGFSTILDFSYKNSNITLAIRSPDKRNVNSYLMLNVMANITTEKNILYKKIVDTENDAFYIKNLYLFCPEFEHDVFAIMHPNDLDKLYANKNSFSNDVIQMLEKNHNNPIVVLLKYSKNLTSNSQY